MLVALAGMLAAGQACTIKVSDRTFDFTSLSGKQLLFNERNYNYQLTICQVAPEACSGYSSSLCQSDESFQFSLGVWSNFTNWRVEGGQLIATAQGVECPEIQKPRLTDITFVCGTGCLFFACLLLVLLLLVLLFLLVVVVFCCRGNQA